MELIVVAALVLLAAFTQATFGFGFALVFTPLAAFVVGPHAAVATSIALSALLSLAVYWEHRPRESLRRVAPLVVPALAAFPLGLALLVHVNEAALRVLVGLAVTAGAGMNVWRSGPAHPERPNRVALMVPMGILSGVLRGATGMGGPPIVLYQHWVGGDAAAIRRRLFAYFAFFATPGIPMALLSGVLTLDVWGFVLAGVPAVGLGIVLGRALRPHLAEHWFQRLSMALLALTAGAAVVGAALAIL